MAREQATAELERRGTLPCGAPCFTQEKADRRPVW
jgi:hypothetical protein